jgi:tight adherence protein B
VVAVSFALGYAVFGGVLAPVAAALFAASAPAAAARARLRRRRETAREAWPRLLEDLRIQTTSLGRSVPQALFDVGTSAPAELRPAFDAARREWLLSTDFERAVGVLKTRLADATADAVGETLLVAHTLGGTQVDRCLAALAEDRVTDLQGRKDADARQAGARFARRFVLVVPLGMAVLGLGVGEGRAAYGTPTGQLLVALALGLMAVCWWWSGRLLRLPADERVFP